MKALSLDSPWAAAAVWQAETALSLPVDTEYRGKLLIQATGRMCPRCRQRIKRQHIPDVSGWPPAKLADASMVFIGVVELVGTARIDELYDEVRAWGPYVWTVRRGAILNVPIPAPRNIPGDLAAVDDALVVAVGEQAMSRGGWCSKHTQAAPEPTVETTHPKRRDGWVGD